MRKIFCFSGRGPSIIVLVALTSVARLALGSEPTPKFDERLIADRFLYAFGVAAADLDGDGDLDLTAADSRGVPLPNEPDGRGHLYWFENDGSGNFTRRVIKTQEGGLFERHAIGDVNGDGHPDVVVVKNRIGHIVWFENSGHPASDPEWRRHVVTTDLMRAYDVAVVDIDRDGRLDVAASAYSGNVLAWFRNPGAAGFDRVWAKEIIDPKLGESRTIRLGDFNGDGLPDLLGAGFKEGITAWYERTGANENPWKRHVIDDRTPQPTHGSAADVDGDGDADVVMALGMRETVENADDRLHQVVWYENRGQPGAGNRWAKHVIGSLRHAFEAVAADLNFDGRMDVVATRWEKEAGEVIWYENLGGGQWRKRAIKTSWNYTNQVIIADLDGDRRPDIAAQSGGADSELRWWKNVGPAPRPTVKTGTPTPLGLQGLTVNGQIQPRGLPTRYWFEFGADATYGNATEPRTLPPRLAAHFRESWEKNRGQWWGGMGGVLEHVAEESGGFVRYTQKRLPPGDPGAPYDPNHLDGIGALHLAAIIYPAEMEDPEHRSVFLGGGYPDLRDARVDVKLRGVNFNAKGSELVWWTQSDIDFSKQNTKVWQRANWAYTGHTMTDALASGKWEDVHFQLKNNSHEWSYAGNNLEQRRADRYAYGSIDNAQRHLNTDFILLLAFVNPADPPTGAIDLDEFTLAYRNYSLLLPSNGGSLIQAPSDADQNPSKLTDGWRNGKGRMWRSSGKGAEPQELVYRFAKPVTVTRIQLHQHTEWPTKKVEILTSMDGNTWSPLAQPTLDPSSALGPNFSFFIQRDLKRVAHFAKVRLVSGYRSEHRGLGEIEFFGEGADFGTDDDWYNVNLDLSGIKSGQTWHYRLVAESAGEKRYGDDQTYTAPPDGKPLAATGEVLRVSADRASLAGLLTPMGQRAEYHFEYGPTPAYRFKTPATYGGRQEVPRLVVAQLDGLSAATRYHYRLVANNDAGSAAGSDQTFVTKPKESAKPYDSVPVKTGQRQLFLDDFILGDLFGVTRIIHPPMKFAGNPVIRPDRPTDGLAIQMRDGPSWDEQEKVWKAWYNRKGHFGNGWGSGFARSKDGIVWEKPDLGIAEIDGNRRNNVVLVKDHPQAYVQHVMLDPNAPPDRRYKGMLGPDGRKPIVSADGFTFTVLPVPAIPSQDESHLTWDDLQQQYLLTVKHNGPFGRAVYLSVSRDFEQWTASTLIYHADALDQTLAESYLRKLFGNERMYRPPINRPREYVAEIYNMPIFTYEGVYIGLPTYFESSGRIAPPAGNQDGINSVKLVTSRDLHSWTRVGDRRHFIPISEMGDGVVDTGQILAASRPIRMGDELWFYYSGLNVRYRPRPANEPEPYFPYRGGICLAKLRLDGFVSLRGDEIGGFVESRPIRFEGQRLFINGDAAKGAIRAEVTDASGRAVLEGWGLDQCEIITGDQLRAELRWNGRSLRELHGSRVRLRFHLKGADLYSFWFE